MSVSYSMVPQGRYIAVVRVGPKGGKRTVGVYKSAKAAADVHLALKRASSEEVTGRDA